ncbi:MAG: hypothetical protein ACE5JG_03435 [Planctomycetota bacterium]
MTVGNIKRSLTLLNAVAVLAVSATAYAFVRHRGRLGEPSTPPSFQPSLEGAPPFASATQNIGIPLGRYKDPIKAEAGPAKPEPKQEDLRTALQKIGEIKGAVVVYQPYPPYPSILFKYHNKPDPVAIAVGEALETRPHPDPVRAKFERVPAHYLFLGCQPDPKRPGWTYFVFDIDCDGKRIERLHWKREGERVILPEGKPFAKPTEKTVVIQRDAEGNVKISVSFLRKGEREVPVVPEIIETTEPPDEAGTAGEGTAEAGAAQPAAEGAATDRSTDPERAAVTPVPAPVRATAEPRPGVVRSGDRTIRLLESDQGVERLTRDGFRYVRDNREKLIRSVDTAPYRNPRTGRVDGVVVRRIKRGTGADAFGFYADDVIRTINKIPVRSRDQAIQVVEREIRKNVTVIEVGFLRNGRPMVKRFDARDPDVRRAARGLRRR